MAHNEEDHSSTYLQDSQEHCQEGIPFAMGQARTLTGAVDKEYLEPSPDTTQGMSPLPGHDHLCTKFPGLLLLIRQHRRQRGWLVN